MAKESETKKTMDVAKPGKRAPDISSRPVIVGNKPEVQDPMMKTGETVKETKQDETPIATHGNKVIQPLSRHDESGDESNNKQAETPAEKEAKEEAAVVDAVAGQADLGKKNTQAKVNAEELEKLEALNKLIAEKKYFVPIGQVAHRRNQRLLIAMLLLVVIAVGLAAAVDAELLDIGVELPFDLI